MAEHIIIIGAGNGYDGIRDYENNKKYEIWCVPSIYPILAGKRVDKVFEVHPSVKWNPGVRYSELKNKLIIPRALPEVPNATIMPIEELQGQYGLVFSSSIAWMTGYALSLKVKEIVYLGVDMQNGYNGQRDGLFYLLGFAKAMGITVTIPTTSKINIFGKTYGWA